MNTVLLSFVTFVLAFAGMGIGIIFRRRSIRPCHGSAADGEAQCEGCGIIKRTCQMSSEDP